MDEISCFSSLCDEIMHKGRTFDQPVLSYTIANTLIVQSSNINEGTPLFLLKINEDFTFSAYHCGVKCTITTLSKNRNVRLNKWSRVEEAVSRFRH